MAKVKDATYEDLMREVKTYISKEENLALIEKAYLFAAEKHKDQFRKSGEAYIVHPLQVAYYLAGLHAGPSTIAAGLLHDVLEDCDITEEEFKKEFGEEIFFLVEGVTKIGNIEFKDQKEYQAANHRKILIAMAKDIRVILIKLCDRLHNMRTLSVMSDEQKKRISQETLDVYAPIAHRLGISEYKNELEDLAFLYLNPEKYHEIAHLVEIKKAERQKQIAELIKEISAILDEHNIKYRIFGRSKHFYSIYNKMVTKNRRFDQILDLQAIRIITDSDLACYEILGYIHAAFKPIPGRLKDYIAMPKFNMYQSLHTSVINNEGVVFEIQIRTEVMDEIAERGVAAHWRYKEGNYNPETEQKEIEEKLALFRDIISIKDDEDIDDAEFMETLQKDFFDTNVYVMSPKGRVIDLPNGSTPIDFAYRIHTDIGNETVGATINGTLVPLNTVLKTGDVVSLMTKKGTGPSEDWLKFVKTSHARNKIKNYLQKKEAEERKPVIEKGQTLIRDELEKREIDPEWNNPKKLEVIYSQFRFKNVDDFYYAVGNRALSMSSVMEKINKRINNPLSRIFDSTTSFTRKPQPKKIVSKSGVIVAGIDSIQVSMANCCSPLPGDEIVGLITRGSGVKVHRADCPNIAHEKNRLISVSWDEENLNSTKYETSLYIEATDRSFLVSDIVTCLSQFRAGLNQINSTVNEDKVNTTTRLKITVDNAEHLENIMANLRKIPSVTKVERSVQ